jgi:hypothetical protein
MCGGGKPKAGTNSEPAQGVLVDWAKRNSPEFRGAVGGRTFGKFRDALTLALSPREREPERD